MQDQGVPFAGDRRLLGVAAEWSGTGADILLHNGWMVVGQHVAAKLRIPAVLGLPDTHVRADSRVFWAGMAIPR